MPIPTTALRNRNYRLYFCGQLISMSGTWMQSMAMAWLVYRTTHSAFWLGTLSFASQFSGFLLSPFAGVVADHIDRRKLLLAIETIGMIQAFLLAALFFSGVINPWILLLLSIVIGLVDSFELTTRHAIAVDLVGKADLGSAIALNSVVINGSRIIGPALAGVTIALVGEGWCFALNGVSFLAVIIGLMLIKTPTKPRVLLELKKFFSHIAEGARVVRQTPEIRRILIFATWISFVGFPYRVLLPVFAKGVLHGDADTLAWLSAATGIGAVVGAFSLSHTPHSGKLEHRLTLLTILSGLSLITLGASTHLWLSMVANFAIGMFMMGAFPLMNTAIQQIVTDRMRARVLSLYTMTFLGAMPVGSLIAGWLGDRLGAPGVVFLEGGLLLASGIGLNCFYRTKPVSSAHAA